jgi:hypothetical protein
MNKIIISFLLLFIVQIDAQVIRSVDRRVAQLPDRFAVTYAGIKWIQPNVTEPILIVWNRIDLVALALEQPKIEEARQKALLSKDDIYFSIPPKPNYYRDFLNQPINVQFQQKWKAVTSGRVDYNVSTTGYIDYNSGYINANSRVTGTYSEKTNYIDQTRPALNTTIEGLLLQLGEDDKIDTHRLIKDLRASGGVLQNIRLLFSSLQDVYPNDPEINKAIRGLDRLLAESATSVDAMRQLKGFAIHARQMAK